MSTDASPAGEDSLELPPDVPPASPSEDSQPSFDGSSTTSSDDHFEVPKRSLDRFAFLTSVRIARLGKSSSSKEYSISGDEAGVPFLHARVHEEQSASSTGCCRGGGGGGGGGGESDGTGRPQFAVLVSDYSSRMAVMRLSCNRHGGVTVESPPGEVIGYVAVERILCCLSFTLRDLHGRARLLVKCPRYCKQQRQPEGLFQILLPDESEEVGSLSRLHGETPSSAAVYTIQMPEAMGADLKAMIIGVALLFDRKLFA